MEDARGACRASVETPQTFLTPDQAAALVDEFAYGATLKTVAEEYGVSVQTVRSHARRASAAQAAAVPEDVLADYADGVPVSILAERCGVPPDAIKRQARLAGVTVGPRRVASDEVGQIVGLYTDGVSLSEIGKRTGLRPVRVREVLVDVGVQIRPRGYPSRLSEREDEIANLRGQGWSYVRIGEWVGADATTIKKLLSRRNDL